VIWNVWVNVAAGSSRRRYRLAAVEGDDETKYPNPGSRLLTKGSGGDTTSVAKIGDRVYRPRHANSDFVGRLLTSLEHSGFLAAPRYFGPDEQGRDIVSFIPGATTIHPSERDERSYAAVGRLVRQLHDLRGMRDPRRSWPVQRRPTERDASRLY